MKKSSKLLKVLSVSFLILVLMFSLVAGILRNVYKEEEFSYSYFEYSLEGQEYTFREYDSKLCYCEADIETECSIDGENVLVVVNGAELSAKMAEDRSTLAVLVVDTESDPEAEPTYLIFTKNSDPITLTEKTTTVYSDFIICPLGLDKLEAEIGEHYFNSIFCSLSGSISSILVYMLVRSIRGKNKPKKKNGDNRDTNSSIKVKVPATSDVNPTQGKYNLKF